MQQSAEEQAAANLHSAAMLLAVAAAAAGVDCGSWGQEDEYQGASSDPSLAFQNLHDQLVYHQQQQQQQQEDGSLALPPPPPQQQPADLPQLPPATHMPPLPMSYMQLLLDAQLAASAGADAAAPSEDPCPEQQQQEQDQDHHELPNPEPAHSHPDGQPLPSGEPLVADGSGAATSEAAAAAAAPQGGDDTTASPRARPKSSSLKSRSKQASQPASRPSKSTKGGAKPTPPGGADTAGKAVEGATAGGQGATAPPATSNHFQRERRAAAVAGVAKATAAVTANVAFRRTVNKNLAGGAPALPPQAQPAPGPAAAAVAGCMLGGGGSGSGMPSSPMSLGLPEQLAAGQLLMLSAPVGIMHHCSSRMQQQEQEQDGYMQQEEEEMEEEGGAHEEWDSHLHHSDVARQRLQLQTAAVLLQACVDHIDELCVAREAEVRGWGCRGGSGGWLHGGGSGG